MNRPSNLTMFLGHPLVATPVAMVGLSTLYIAYSGGGDANGAALVAVLVMGAVGKATSDAAAYRRWKREWNAMAGESPASGGRLNGCLKFVVGAVLLLIGATMAVTYPNEAGQLALIVGAPLVLLIAVGAWLRARRHRPARAKQAVPVQVVATPTTQASTLDAAYTDLPEHLQHLMKRPGK